MTRHFAFMRYTLRACLLLGCSASFAFAMDPMVVALTTANGSKVIYPGEHELRFSTGGAASDIVVNITM